MSSEAAQSGLNIENPDLLLHYLRLRGLISPGEQPLIRILDGGVSNRVVLVKPEHSKPLVLKQALEKLRVKVDWFCTPARIEREALALRYLSELAPRGSVPALIFEDGTNHLLAMEEVPEPHQNWKQMLLLGEVVQDHLEQFGRLLGCIHNRSSQRGSELLDLFADRAIFEILRLEPYYRYTAGQVPQAAHFLNDLIDDTLACRVCLVHGDYSPKNILVHSGRLVLLDCEVMHCGDPAFDIGFSMTHLLSKAHHLPNMRKAFAVAAIEYWETYTRCAATTEWISQMEPRAVRHTLACCLARVAGRSPLEYLSETERTAQASIVLALMKDAPANMHDLVADFVSRLSCQSLNV